MSRFTREQIQSDLSDSSFLHKVVLTVVVKKKSFMRLLSVR